MCRGEFRSKLLGFFPTGIRESPTFAAGRWGVLVPHEKTAVSKCSQSKGTNMKSTGCKNNRLSRPAAIKLLVGLLGCLVANSQQAQIGVGASGGATTVASGSIVAAGSVMAAGSLFAGTTLLSATTLTSATSVYGGAVLASGSSFAAGTVLAGGRAAAAGGRES